MKRDHQKVRPFEQYEIMFKLIGQQIERPEILRDRRQLAAVIIVTRLVLQTTLFENITTLAIALTLSACQDKSYLWNSVISILLW